MHLIIDTGAEDIIEQCRSAFYQDGVYVSLREVAEDKRPIGVVGIDDSRTVGTKEAAVGGQEMMPIEHYTDGVAPAPSGSQQAWVVEQGGACTDHDCHILRPHLMYQLFSKGCRDDYRVAVGCGLTECIHIAIGCLRPFEDDIGTMFLLKAEEAFVEASALFFHYAYYHFYPSIA